MRLKRKLRKARGGNLVNDSLMHVERPQIALLDKISQFDVVGNVSRTDWVAIVASELTSSSP